MASILRYWLLQVVVVSLLAVSVFSQVSSRSTLDPQRLQNIQQRMQQYVDRGLSAGRALSDEQRKDEIGDFGGC